MKTNSTAVVRRSEYQPPAWLIDSVHLDFELDPDQTRVTSTMQVARNPRASGPAQPMLLNGEVLEMVDLRINGVSTSKYHLTDDTLVIDSPPDTFELQTEVLISPEKNTTLSGLYTSNDNFFTQCEAEGFRRITWFADRPDVMSRFTVTLRAPRSRYPVLLSNGNLTSKGDCSDKKGWHWARWEDPFPKPSYLFALVAGKLVNTEKTIKTNSGKERLLQVWVEPGNEDKTAHAMASLVRAIEWDEEKYGLELDLDRFMIVAVSDFNMGAMENKGLNIFNTKYVFANPKIATDADLINIESVVGHEYFHNWTGNRVTCRDWFQLTLKEGLTVFRDQEFTADTMARQASTQAGRISARIVKRIEDVRLLRIAQFAEDAGPMAHPIRPDTYSEINNFYTVTVYEKGAEVIRMLHTLVGDAGFRRGMDLYFERHDGQAVTCDDFIDAIAVANTRDFTQFAHWYSQAGTPVVSVRTDYDETAGAYTLHLAQSCPPTPGQPDKLPFHIPLTVALLDESGNEMALHLADEPHGNKSTAPDALQTSRVLELTEREHVFTFTGIGSRPTASLLRGFSAPVILDYAIDEADLAFLAQHDTDPFNRWEATQRLAVAAVLGVLAGDPVAQRAALIEQAMARALRANDLDPAYQALVLTLPAEGYISEQLNLVDPVAVRAARNAVRLHLASKLHDLFEANLHHYSGDGPYRIDNKAAGRRAMKHLALNYLVATGDAQYQEMASALAGEADNMTDQAGALSTLVNSDAPQREAALDRFARQFAHEALVMDKWFSMQATMHRQQKDPPVIERIKELMQHPAFSIKNPNRARSLIGAFCSGNLAEFHAPDGSGYGLWLEQVRALDRINPQVASRLARAMDRWRKFDLARQTKMKSALAELAHTDALSRDVTEIVGKALAGTTENDAAATA